MKTENQLSPPALANLANLAKQAAEAVENFSNNPAGVSHAEVIPIESCDVERFEKSPLIWRCCADCRHFQPNPHSPRQGIGQCALGDPSAPVYWPEPDNDGRYRHKTPRALWPHVSRLCDGFITKPMNLKPAYPSACNLILMNL